MDRQYGFTLIELILAIMLMGIISAMVGKILFHGYQSFLTNHEISETDWKGILSLTRVVDDIHRIQSVGGMTTIQSDLIEFTDVTGSSVQYALSGRLLLRNSQIMTNGVQSLVFTYFDKNGIATTTPSSVRYIAVSLAINEGSLTQTFSTMGATRGMPG